MTLHERYLLFRYRKKCIRIYISLPTKSAIQKIVKVTPENTFKYEDGTYFVEESKLIKDRKVHTGFWKLGNPTQIDTENWRLSGEETSSALVTSLLNSRVTRDIAESTKDKSEEFKKYIMLGTIANIAIVGGVGWYLISLITSITAMLEEYMPVIDYIRQQIAQGGIN